MSVINALLSPAAASVSPLIINVTCAIRSARVVEFFIPFRRLVRMLARLFISLLRRPCAPRANKARSELFHGYFLWLSLHSGRVFLRKILTTRTSESNLENSDRNRLEIEIIRRSLLRVFDRSPRRNPLSRDNVVVKLIVSVCRIKPRYHRFPLSLPHSRSLHHVAPTSQQY